MSQCGEVHGLLWLVIEIHFDDELLDEMTRSLNFKTLHYTQEREREGGREGREGGREGGEEREREREGGRGGREGREGGEGERERECVLERERK